MVIKKIGIITLNGYFNYGNRLQNYALTKYLEDNGCEVYTIWDKNTKQLIKEKIKKSFKFLFKYKRFYNFYNFSKKYIKEISSSDVYDKEIDHIIVGSDQTWNPMEIISNNKLLGIGFENIPLSSYAASLGKSDIPKELNDLYFNSLSKFKYISVREKAGKKYLKKLLGRSDIEVNIDPTLLLNKEDWKSIMTKPKNYNGEKYILNYFLGELSDLKSEEIKKIAQKNNYKIVNILDPKDQYYVSSPSDFLYLIYNAEYIFTDSFHACVFSFIFDKSFIIFEI